ncbi:MAG: ABC transporter ATP-binding protein [Acidobacteriaceae bacterium]
MLEVAHVSKVYTGIPAVDDVSFQIARGEIVGFIGPNGAGKSTTVKIITGMVQPTRGRVLFEGTPVLEDILNFRARLGYVPEEAHLYPHLSGLEHLQLVGRLRGLGERLILKRSTVLLEQLGLDSWRHTPISLYSKGMRQRILLATAILHNPQLIVLDEPLSGLDVVTAQIFRDLLTELAADGKAILYISHVLEIVEKVCDRVLVIAKGRVRADAPPQALCDRMSLPDLHSVFASLVEQFDTRVIARSLVEAIHADAV